MGAGARMAAERDRWPAHWRVADFDIEEEGVLDLLQPAEELVALVPGTHSTPGGVDNQVLVAVTDRRVIVVGRSRRASGELRIIDVTECSTTSPRLVRQVPHVDGHLMFDLDDAAIARMWARIDDVHGLEQPAPGEQRCR
jgi:hypothetical protein